MDVRSQRHELLQACETNLLKRNLDSGALAGLCVHQLSMEGGTGIMNEPVSRGKQDKENCGENPFYLLSIFQFLDKT